MERMAKIMDVQGNVRIAVGTSPNIRRVAIAICSMVLGWAQCVSAQQQLENPRPDSFQSGISPISGWVCNAQKVQIRVDNQILLDTVYGTGREDTRQHVVIRITALTSWSTGTS